MPVWVKRFTQALPAILALAWIASQYAATRTESINWDEFALFARAVETSRTGHLTTGGRPGLGTLLLVPFAKSCANSAVAIAHARGFWLLFTVGYLLALFIWVRLSSPQRNWFNALLAVGLLALTPAFLRWSLQVRTDQPALMFAAWAGVLLSLAWRRQWFAVPAGLSFALGYLCSQKAVYLAPLAVGLLSLQLLRQGKVTMPRIWRAGTMVGLAAGVAFLSIIGLRVALLDGGAQVANSVQAELGTFAYYRSVFGFRAYIAMLPTLVPQVVLCSMVVLSPLVARVRLTRDQWVVWVTASSILLLGAAVCLFHAAAFPYFWMTLGVFPAVAVGVAWPLIFDVFRGTFGRSVLIAAVPLLLAGALSFAFTLHTDTQAIQRGSMLFIERNFPVEARGFQMESALACRRDPDPFPTFFAQQAINRWTGPGSAERIAAMEQEFRHRPVTFVIKHRIFALPEQLDSFLSSHYVLYRREVMLPGRAINGARGETTEFEVFVPGRYRWWPSGSDSRVAIDGEPRTADAPFDLAAGVHSLTIVSAQAQGLVTLAVTEPPEPAGPTFYAVQPIREIDPLHSRR